MKILRLRLLLPLLIEYHARTVEEYLYPLIPSRLKLTDAGRSENWHGSFPKRACPLFRIRDRMIHIGACLVRHGRCATFQMAEIGLSRQVFGEILKRIHRLSLVGTAVP